MLRRVALLAMMVSGCTLVGEEPTEFGAPEEPVISPADVTELAIGAGDIQRNVDFLDSVLTRRDRTRPLDRAAAWLAERFRAAGFTPAGDLSGYLQYRSIRGVDPDSLLLPNVVATLPGSDPARSGEYVI
ncbi:MAG TPA: hypothetical protein VK966_04990, partial [Longimicrobiales bacterium]|nr:hypothetical protein [Longimicrobiales bacterium]